MSFVDDVINKKRKKDEEEENSSYSYKTWASKNRTANTNTSNENTSWYKNFIKQSEGLENAQKEYINAKQTGNSTWNAINNVVNQARKSTLSSIGDAGLNVVKGIMNIGEGIGDAALNSSALMSKQLGNLGLVDKEKSSLAYEQLKAKAQTNAVDNALSKPTEALDKNSVFGETSDKVFQGIGYTAGLMAITAAGGGGAAGTSLMNTTTFTSALGSNWNEANQKEGITDTQAWIKAMGSAGIETLTENLFGFFGKSGLDTAVANKVASKITSGAGKVLARLGVSATGEAAEEFISYSMNQGLDRFIDTASNGKGAKFSKDWDWNEVGESMATAFISSALFQGSTNVSEVTKTMQSKNMSFNEALNDLGYSQDIQAKADTLNADIEKLNKKLEKATDNKTKIEIQNQINEKTLEINKILSKEKNTSKKENLPTQEQSANEVLLPMVENNTDLSQEQKNSMIGYLNNNEANQADYNAMRNTMDEASKNKNENLPTQRIQLEQSDNTRINDFRQSVNDIGLQDNEKTRSLIDMSEGIMNRMDNMSIKYNTNILTSDNKLADGKVTVKDGQITMEVNPNSEKAMEYLMTHELIHPYVTNDMRKMIKTFAENKNNTLFNEAIKEAQQKYGTTEITDEVVADAGAQLFGNQEFLNQVATEKPGMLKQIYNKIVSMLNKITGYSNEKLMLQDFKAKIESAIRNNEITMGNNTEAYYISNVANFNEMEYNSVNELKLPKKEYAILSSIVNSDSNIKPGINEVETTNAQYKVYFKETGEFKVLDKVNNEEDNNVFGRTLSGNEKSGVQRANEQLDSKEIPDRRTTTYNDGISEINQAGTSERSESNRNGKTNSRNIEDSNKSSFSMSKNTFDGSKYENLNNASTIYFRQRDNGGFYVQATDTAGNVTYDGNFMNEKSLQKSFGDEIASYIVNNAEVDVNNEAYIDNSNKVTSETDYMMTHRPTESGAYASDISNNGEYMPIDVYEHPEYYFSNIKADYSKESINILKRIKGNPNADVTIYRATTGNKINEGDWVTLSKKYAEYHNNTQLDGNGNVVELNVKAKDIQFAGDDINEFGYFPQSEKYSLPVGNKYNQFIKETFDFGEEGTKTYRKDILPVAENTKQTKVKNVIEADTTNNIESDEQIAQVLDEKPQKAKEKSRALAIMKANLIDKGIVFEELSRKAEKLSKNSGKNKSYRDLQGKWDYTLTSTARGQNAIGNARYEFNENTKEQTQLCKSLEDIRKEVGDSKSDFQKYMYHQLNIDRMTLEDRFGGDTGLNYERASIQNKPVFGDSVTAEVSQRIVNQYEESNPEFKEWAKDVYDYLKADRQELVKNGVISEELSQRLEDMYPHYVPISRVRDNGSAINVPLDTGKTGINSPLKRAKGGSSNINPLFETMADRTMQTYRASAKNSFGVELKNTLQDINQFAPQGTEQIDVSNILDEVTTKETSDALLQEGKDGNNPTFTVFEDGNKITYEISKDMYDALKPTSEVLNKLSESKVGKILNKISNLRRGVLTEYNPVFLFTNAIKDAQDVLMNSQHAGKTYSKFPEAYAQIVKKGYWYNEYVANGGEQNSYFTEGEFVSDKKMPVSSKVLSVPLNAISSINNVIEMAPRLSEYIASREAGRSIETSMLDASRVTTNFKAGGDITKFANRNGATFLNASVQGATQAVRNIQEANAKGLKGYAVLATKMAIASIPAMILNGLLWKDDKDYEELQDYVKDNYYIIGKYGDGQFIRIPKGRAVAVMQKVVNSANKYINENKELNVENFSKDFWDEMKFAMDNLAPNNPLDNNVISPIIQVMNNTSWYGSDIVPSRLQDKPAEEQYDETTDSLSIWLGDKLNVSPYKINYLLDQYGGGLSDILLPTMTKQAENNMVEDKFTTNSVMKSRYPGEFFEKVDELKVNSNSSKATDEDKLKYKYISEVSTKTSDLYKEKREIQNSDLSDKEKKEKILEVQKEINKLAKEGMENVEKLKIDGDTATIGETTYYKKTDLTTGEKTWTKMTEKEETKNANLPTKTYVDYKEKVDEETIKQRNSGAISEDGTINNKSKIEILLNSNYTDKEKTEIYTNYINKKDSLYNVIKETNLNIDDYLKYEIQDFSSDRTDDGTLKGKSISGSKKQKIVDWLNENIPEGYGNERLLLYASNGYSITKSQRNQLYNYVKSLGLDQETNESIFSKFSGFTVYKNGTVTY